MKSYKIVYQVDKVTHNMIVHADSLKKARTTATSLVNGDNTTIICVVESKELTEHKHKNIYLCEGM